MYGWDYILIIGFNDKIKYETQFPYFFKKPDKFNLQIERDIDIYVYIYNILWIRSIDKFMYKQCIQ